MKKHLSIASSESDPEDSFWRDFNFDFSFLTSDEQKTGLPDEDIDSNTLPKAGESELSVVDSNGEEPSPPPLASVLRVTSTTQNDAVAKEDIEACSRNKSPISPLFTKISALQCSSCSVPSDTEVDSPCWKGTWSRNSTVSGRRSRDDLNVLYGLNPMAPQFIPSNVKMINLEFEGNSSSSLKRSLSSTFPPSSGNDLYEQGSDHKNNIGILMYDADESLGLASQDSVSETMGILDITNQFQSPTKLDPLAPVFVPSYEKFSLADPMIATEENAHSTYAYSQVGHIGTSSSQYSNNVLESGETYSSNPRLGSQVHISENTKLDSSSNNAYGSKKKLNPLAPQFSLADTKPKVYGSVENQSAILFSPRGYMNHKELHAQPSVHVEPSLREVDTGRHFPNILNGNSSPQMDVKKLLTTIHGLSELLTHVHGSPNEQDLDLISSTVHNLNSYINNGAQEHTGKYGLPNMCKQSTREQQIPKARNVSTNIDFKRKDKYPMVTGAEPQVEYGVTKVNGFGQVVRNHQSGEQINPQVLFYKSLWLKARADSSLMEYETFLSNSRT